MKLIKPFSCEVNANAIKKPIRQWEFFFKTLHSVWFTDIGRNRREIRNIVLYRIQVRRRSLPRDAVRGPASAAPTEMVHTP